MPYDLDDLKTPNKPKPQQATQPAVKSTGGYDLDDLKAPTQAATSAKTYGPNQCWNYSRDVLRSKGWSGSNTADLSNPKYGKPVSMAEAQPGDVVHLKQGGPGTTKHWAVVGPDGNMNELQTNQTTRQASITTNRPLSAVRSRIVGVFRPNVSRGPVTTGHPESSSDQHFQTQHIINYMNSSFNQGLGPAQMKVIHPDFAPRAIDNAHADWLKQKQAKQGGGVTPLNKLTGQTPSKRAPGVVNSHYKAPPLKLGNAKDVPVRLREVGKSIAERSESVVPKAKQVQLQQLAAQYSKDPKQLQALVAAAPPGAFDHYDIAYLSKQVASEIKGAQHEPSAKGLAEIGLGFVAPPIGLALFGAETAKGAAEHGVGEEAANLAHPYLHPIESFKKDPTGTIFAWLMAGHLASKGIGALAGENAGVTPEAGNANARAAAFGPETVEPQQPAVTRSPAQESPQPSVTTEEPWAKSATVKEHVNAIGERYPVFTDQAGGIRTKEGPVPNMASLDSSLDNYEELSGIRSVKLSDLETDPNKLFYAADDMRHVQSLAEQIKGSGELSPLVVVVDKDGPYVLEGAHRLGALHELGYDSVPAKVAIDTDSLDISGAPTGEGEQALYDLSKRAYGLHKKSQMGDIKGDALKIAADKLNADIQAAGFTADDVIETMAKYGDFTRAPGIKPSAPTPSSETAPVAAVGTGEAVAPKAGESATVAEGGAAGQEPEKLVGIKNAETEKTLGEPRVKPEVFSEKAQMDSVKKDIDAGRIKPEKMVTQLSNGETPDLEPWEVQRTLHYRTAQLDNEFEEAVKAQSEAGESGDAKAIKAAVENYDAVKSKVDELAKAAQQSGTPLGLGMQARVAMMKAREFELTHVISRAEAKKGGPLTSEERAAFQSQIESLKGMIKFADDMESILRQDLGLDPAAKEESAAKDWRSKLSDDELKKYDSAKKMISESFLVSEKGAVGRLKGEGGKPFDPELFKAVKDAVSLRLKGEVLHLSDVVDEFVRDHTEAIRPYVMKAIADLRKNTDAVTAQAEKVNQARQVARKVQTVADNFEANMAKRKAVLAELEGVAERGETVDRRHSRKLTEPELADVNRRIALLRRQVTMPRAMAERQASAMKSVNTERANLKDMADSGYVPTPASKLALTNEYIAARSEARDMQIRLKSQSEPTRTKGTLDKIQSAVGVLKTLAFASPHWLRPDMGMLGANPRAFWAGLKAGVTSLVSPEAYEQAQGRVHESPNFNISKGWGLDNDVSPRHGDSEFFGSDKPSRIRFLGRWYTANARSYTIIGNVARQYAMDAWIDARGGLSNIDPKEGMDYAKVLNDVTRRGKTGLQGNTAKLANIVFSSPKAMAGDIGSYTDAFSPFNKITPEARLLAARSLAARYAAGMGFMGLAALAGAKVHPNPLDRKFGTVEVGNTSLGVFGGIEIPFRDVAEAVYQGATGKQYSTKMVKGSHFVPAKWGHDPWEVLFNLNTSGYLGSHASPAMGLARNVIMSQEKNLPPWEQPFWREKPADIAEEFVYPIGAKAIADAWKDGGFERALLVSPFALTGLEANTSKPMPKAAKYKKPADVKY